MKQALAAFLVGLLFAIGLGISGMTQPQKVIGFLDVFNWNPSLVFVMVGAIAVHAVLYRIVRKRASPLFDNQWRIPNRQDVTGKIVLGSSIFGIGWGLSGYCPGPAVTALASGQTAAFAFIGSMLVGMFVYSQLNQRISSGAESDQD